MLKEQQGWCNDITGLSGRRRHYYKNGISLCGKHKVKHFFNIFDPDSPGDKYTQDCCICIKRLKILRQDEKHQ
jgi:hypothetical protein